MDKYNTCGLPMKLISLLSGLNPSTISRFVQAHELKPMGELNKRNSRYSINNTRKILSDLYTSKHSPRRDKSVLSFYNFKGGTGKTSISYQIATHIALCGYKVLVIDADPQGHLSTSLGFNFNENYFTLYDGLINNIEPDKIIKNVFEGLDCIPSNLSLTRIEMKLNELPRRELRLEDYLTKTKDRYDYVIFDTNPTISHLNRNILNFTDILNIVCETHPFSINGLKLLMEDIKTFYENMKEQLPEIMIIPNKYEDRASSSLEAMTALSKFWGEYLMKDFAVRKSEDYPRSAKEQLPIGFFCKVNSIAFADIADIIKELIKRSEIKQEELKTTGDSAEDEANSNKDLSQDIMIA